VPLKHLRNLRDHRTHIGLRVISRGEQTEGVDKLLEDVRSVVESLLDAFPVARSIWLKEQRATLEWRDISSHTVLNMLVGPERVRDLFGNHHI